MSENNQMARIPSSAERGDCWGMIALLLFLIGLGMLTLDDYGMGWDEPTRWASGDLKLDYYEGFASAESAWAHFGAAPPDTYPGLFDLPLAWAARHWEIDRFRWGHWWSFCFGALGVLAAGWLARRVASGAAVLPVGVLAGVALLLLPSYYGHLYLNPKDIPFAATYACAVVGLLGFVSAFPRPSVRRTFGFGVLVGLAASTRLPGGVVLGYAALLAIIWLLFRRLAGATSAEFWREAGGLLWRGLLVGVVAFLILLCWWPAGQRNLLGAPIAAAEKLHSAAKAIPVLFEGGFYEAGNTPPLYLPLLLAYKLPLWSLALGFLSLYFGSQYFRRTGAPNPVSSSSARLWWRRSALVLALAFPAVYAFLVRPALHNGIRHLLYLLPLFAAVLGVTIDALHRRLRPYAWWRRGGALAALAGLLVVGIWPLLRLHPYQYIYYNMLAGGTSGSLGRFETEYWFTSTREGIVSLESFLDAHPDERPENRPVRVFLSGPWQVAEPFLPEGFAITGDVSEADFILSNTQMMVHTLFDGTEIFRIERAGLPILIALKPSERR